MARIVHVALKVSDLESATRFYETLFGFRQTGTGYARGHVSRHMTDGQTDVALMVYDSEDVEEARLSGSGPCIHHWGIEVEDREEVRKRIEANGGQILSKPAEGALKFRAPNGIIAEIVRRGRYQTAPLSDRPRVVGLAIEVADVQASHRFYADVFGFRDKTGGMEQGGARRLTDGYFELALLPRKTGQSLGRIDHLALAVDNPDSFWERIGHEGGEVLSRPGEAILRYRAPDGTEAELIGTGES